MKLSLDSLITTAPLVIVVFSVLIFSDVNSDGNTMAIIGLTGILSLSLSIRAIIHIIKGSKEASVKVFWAMIIAFAPFFGALLYMSKEEQGVH